MKNFGTVVEIPEELIKLWETAWRIQPSAEKPFVLHLDTPRQALNMRQHLYQARKKLIASNYPGSHNFSKLEITMPKENELALIVPRWLQAVQETLAGAGIKMKEILEPIEPSEETDQEAVLKHFYGSGPGPEEAI